MVITLMSLLIMACGGGESSSAPASTYKTDVAIIEEPLSQTDDLPVEGTSVELDPNAIYDTTANLIASKSFLLRPEYELAISYSNDDNRSVYLSLCSEFTEGESSIKVNYNSCLVRAYLESNYSDTLMVANNKNDLVMAIWYLDDVENPRYEVWKNDNNTQEVKTFYVD